MLLEYTFKQLEKENPSMIEQLKEGKLDSAYVKEAHKLGFINGMGEIIPEVIEFAQHWKMATREVELIDGSMVKIDDYELFMKFVNQVYDIKFLYDIVQLMEDQKIEDGPRIVYKNANEVMYTLKALKWTQVDDTLRVNILSLITNSYVNGKFINPAKSA